VQIVNHLLRIRDRRHLVATRKQLARTPARVTSSCFHPLIIVG
jgi:hypothetical protein